MRQLPALLINDLTVLRSYRVCSPPHIRYNLVPVTRIAFWWNKRGDGEEDVTTRGRMWPEMCK